MQPKIGFIVPCGRDFKSHGIHTVNSILHYHSMSNTEILISSKETINNFGNVYYVPEPHSNVGAVMPINNMACIAKGKFICVLNDDNYLRDNIEHIPDFIESHNLVGLGLMPSYWKPGEYDPIPDCGINIPHNIHNMGFPIIKKEFITRNNQLFCSAFTHHYADCLLPLCLKVVYGQNQFIFDDNKTFIYFAGLKSIDRFSKNQYNSDYEIYKRILWNTYLNV